MGTPLFENLIYSYLPPRPLLYPLNFFFNILGGLFDPPPSVRKKLPHLWVNPISIYQLHMIDQFLQCVLLQWLPFEGLQVQFYETKLPTMFFVTVVAI